MYGDDGDKSPLRQVVVLDTVISGKNKAISTQVGSAYANGAWDQVSGSTFVGPWCVIARPLPPEMDAGGVVRAACEAICAEFGDSIVAVGQRDVRWSKFAQDMQPGESVFFNAFASRLSLAEAGVTLMSARGSYLALDIEDQTTSLVGYPSTNKGAARVVLTTTGVSIVCPSGQNFVVVSDQGLTISAAQAVFQAGKIALGLGSSQAYAVVTLADLVAFAASIVAQHAAHTHTSAAPGSPTSPPIAPMNLAPTGSKTVTAAP